jgi:hypothetical protein
MTKRLPSNYSKIVLSTTSSVRNDPDQSRRRTRRRAFTEKTKDKTLLKVKLRVDFGLLFLTCQKKTKKK